MIQTHKATRRDFDRSRMWISGCLLVFMLTGFPLDGFAQTSQTAQQEAITALESQIATTEGKEKAELLVQLSEKLASSDIDKARESLYQALTIGESEGDSVLVGRVLHKQALSLYFAGSYESSLMVYQRAFKAFESVQNTDGQALVLNDIGTLVKKQGDLDRALEYFEQALAISESGRDSLQIASSINNMGIVFDVKGDATRAMEHFQRSAAINEKLGNEVGLSYNMDNMGMVSSRMERWKEAEEFFLKAADLRKGYGDLRAYGIVINNIGEMYAIKGDPSTALPYFEQALDIARETRFADFEQYVLGQISTMHELRGDFQTALSYYKTQSSLADSLFNESRSRQLIEIETKFDTERKEQTIALQHAKLERNYLILGGVLVLFALLAVTFYSYRTRMEVKLLNAETKAYLTSQEEERKRIALDLHDGLGQLISSTRMQVKSSLEAEAYAKPEAMFDEIHKEIRNIAFNLMPATLLKKGAAAAIEELGRRIAETSSVSIAVTALDLDERLSENTEITLFRIVQEWLNNILKHSGAAEINIQFIGHTDELVVMIEDDGRGFDPSILDYSNGHGWKNILTRSRHIGGRVLVDSTAENEGTTFILKVPLIQEIGQKDVSAA